MDEFEKILRLKNSKEWIEFEKYYCDKSFTKQLGLFRYEDVHTNFLASLLNVDNVYGYGDKPFRLFLELIRAKNNNKNGNKYLDTINLLDEYDVLDLMINIRKKLKNGIPDLYITFKIKQGVVEKKYLIILEAKLESDEHDNQCDSYYNDVKDINVDEKIFIYLTLDGGACSNDNYNLISYQNLIDYIYEPLTCIKANNVALTIDEYLKSFNSLYDIEFKNFDCYPITNEGKLLTTKLWKKSLKIDDLWDTNLWEKLYLNNPIVFRTFIINSLKLENELEMFDNKLTNYYKRMKYRITFDDEEIEISKGIHYLFVKLVEYYSIENIEDIDSRIIVTTGNWKNIIANSKIDSIPIEKKEKYYKRSDSVIFNNENYWYVTTNETDVENFIEILHECYPEFASKIKIKPYIIQS